MAKGFLSNFFGFTETDISYADFYSELIRKGLPVNSDKYWWVNYPERAIREISRMEEHTNAVYRLSKSKLIWEEVISNNFKTKFHISIEVSDGFPHKQPKVFIKESEIKIKKTKHIYKDGSLCLMHPNEYSSNISVLEIRNLACAWCWAVEVYNHTNTWPTAEAD